MIIFRRTVRFNLRVFDLLKTNFGLGQRSAKLVCDKYGITRKLRMKAFTKRFGKRALRYLERKVEDTFLLDRMLARTVSSKVKEHRHIGTYRGVRLRQGLPSRGQRTRSNAKTARKLNRQF